MDRSSIPLQDERYAEKAIILRRQRDMTLSKAEYQGILDRCVPSKLVRDHLSEMPLSAWSLGELLWKAPISIYEKERILRSLVPKENILDRVNEAYSYRELHSKLPAERWQTYFEVRLRHIIGDSFMGLHNMVQNAIEAFESTGDGVFNLVEKWFDDELLDEKGSTGQPFLSTKKAIEYIEHDMRECEFDDETEAWYEIEKWVEAGEGDLERRYRFILIGAQPVFFERYEHGDGSYGLHGDPTWMVRGLREAAMADGFINIPLPISTGDIVSIDCLPFAPVKPAVIIEQPSFDCCYPTMLSKNTEGTWNITSLKHGYFSKGNTLALSPLYRLDHYQGELAEDEKILYEVQEWLRSDPERGACFWDADYPNHHCMTADDVRRHMMLAEEKWKMKDGGGLDSKR